MNFLSWIISYWYPHNNKFSLSFPRYRNWKLDSKHQLCRISWNIFYLYRKKCQVLFEYINSEYQHLRALCVMLTKMSSVMHQKVISLDLRITFNENNKLLHFSIFRKPVFYNGSVLFPSKYVHWIKHNSFRNI